MLVLIVFQDEKMRILVTGYLEGRFGIEVHGVGSSEEANFVLEQDFSGYSVLIADAASHDSLKQFMVRKSISLPILGLGGEVSKKGHWISSSEMADGLTREFEKIAERNPKLDLKEPGKYVKISPEILFFTSPLPSPLFVRISDEKYLKVMLSGERFQQEDFDHLLTKKGFSTLFIQSKDLKLFMDPAFQKLDSVVSTQIDEKLAEQLSRIDTQALEAHLGEALDSVLKKSKGLGFSPAIQALTKKIVASTIHSVRNSPGLTKILGTLSKEPDKYLSAHSLLLSYVNCAIASQLEWTSDSTYQKLTLASFLHDSVFENHELAKIQTLDELETKKAQFTEEELEQYREHPILASQIARRFSETPPDVDLIIMQHHELPGGDGFPRGLSALRIGPLSAVFIISHDLVCYLLKGQSLPQVTDPTLLKTFVEERKEKYKSGAFRKILPCVLRLQS